MNEVSWNDLVFWSAPSRECWSLWRAASTVSGGVMACVMICFCMRNLENLQECPAVMRRSGAVTGGHL